MPNDVNLVKQINLLDKQNREELQRYVAFLLSKQERLIASTTSGHKTSSSDKKLLVDLETLSVPVNDLIIDRAELYEDRI